MTSYDVDGDRLLPVADAAVAAATDSYRCSRCKELKKIVGLNMPRTILTITVATHTEALVCLGST
jgi:hypothetical protein